MPQIPLFVSSAKAGTDSTGSFSVDFLPPMELPATAKNATIEVTQLTCPFTTPNITTSNNKLVVVLPNVTRDATTKVPGGTINQRFVMLRMPQLKAFRHQDLPSKKFKLRCF